MELYFLNYETGREALLPYLSEARLRRVRAAKAPAVQSRLIFSYALLRLALFERFGITEPPEFEYGPFGKPFLTAEPEKFFNISHAENAVLCAVSTQPVGADVQDIRPLKTDISRRICTPSELERLNSAEDKDRELCRLWCLKESRGKLTGKGFSEGFCGIEAEKLLSEKKAFLTERGGFFISACTERPEEVRLHEITESELITLCYDLSQHRAKNG